MVMRFLAFLGALLIVHPAMARAQGLDLEAMDALIEDQIGETDPGLAVGVVVEGEVVYERYVGLADLEHRIAVGRATRFNIASNAKQFTALAILDLVDRGELSLDDDVRKFFPDLLKDIEHPILLRHLLTHRSGIRDVYDLWAISGVTWWQEFIGNEDALELLGRQTDLNFESGSEYLYSNSNYILLAEIVSQISDEPIEIATRSLFDQLGMNETGFVSNYMTVIPNRARGYGNFGEWVAFPAVTGLYGDGWLYSTLWNQLAWEAALQRDRPMADNNLLPTSQREPAQGAYGYGVEFGNYRGIDYLFHDGSTGAFNASFSRFPDQQVSIVVMSNNGQVSTRDLVNSIADTVLRLESSSTQFPERPGALLERPSNADVLGLYDNPGTGSRLRIVEREGQLVREIEGRDPVALLHEQGNLFSYASNPDLRMAFDTTESGERRLTIYFASQQPSPAVRVAEAPASDTYLNELVGRYLNRETGTEFSLRTEDGDLLLNIFGKDTIIRITVKDTFEALGYRLAARRSDAGEVVGFRLAGGRLRRVWFEKLDCVLRQKAGE